MTPDADSDPTLERAYPYCSGLRVMGCAAFFFAAVGGAGVAMMPFGCEQMRAGKLPLGVALLAIGLFTTPMLLFAVLALVTGIRNTVRPPLLRVTPAAIVLPDESRGEPPQVEPAGPVGDSQPPHPPEIPFAAIRWARRESNVNPGSDRLVIVHDLAPTTLVIEQYMMRREDFDELEMVLRAAIPAAFAPAPPTDSLRG
jgi:hypothetical protein